MALDVGSDTGTNTTDNVTKNPQPTIAIRVDLTPLAGLAFSAGYNPGTDTPGYKVAVSVDGVLAGYAIPAGSGLFNFTPAGALSDGLHLVTARVVIVDPKLPNTARRRQRAGVLHPVAHRRHDAGRRPHQCLT